MRDSVITVERSLQECFLRDKFVLEPTTGEGLLWVVCSARGDECGRILWTEKLSQDWDSNWVAELKKQQQSAKADIGVIVSHRLPQSIQIRFYEGVWLVEYSSVIRFAASLREGLLTVNWQPKVHRDR